MNWNNIFNTTIVAAMWDGIAKVLSSILGIGNSCWPGFCAQLGWLVPILLFILALPFAFDLVEVALSAFGFEINPDDPVVRGIHGLGRGLETGWLIATGHGGMAMRRHATERYNAEHPTTGRGSNPYDPDTIPEMVGPNTPGYNPLVQTAGPYEALDEESHTKSGMIRPVAENENTYHPRTVAGEIHDGSGEFRNRA